MNTEALKNVNLYLFDMDGTLYLGNQLFPFTTSLLQAVKNSGKKYLFITNNSSKSVVHYVEKLEKLGIPAEEGDFLTSSQATIYYLQKNYPGKRLYVCGTQSLKSELAENGFEITEDPDRTECIVMGFDTELTFQKIDDVAKMLCTRDLPYIATHPDMACPTEYGSVPDCGSVCEMLFQATGKRPFVVGKPKPLMVELAMEKAGFQKHETAVVGDRLCTDILCGLNAGAVSVLVLSGETTPELLEASAEKPDIVLQDAGEIMKYLQ